MNEPPPRLSADTPVVVAVEDALKACAKAIATIDKALTTIDEAEAAFRKEPTLETVYAYHIALDRCRVLTKELHANRLGDATLGSKAKRGPE